MGVSGTGKSTVAAGIARTLDLDCIDGDDLHAPEAVAKMRSGTPLTDDDRWPWLDRIGARLCAGRESHAGDAARVPNVASTSNAGATGSPASRGTVVSCSALKLAYRDRLRAAAPGVRFIFLDGSPELIRARMLVRRDHYMPPGLLDSQLMTLQRPGADEADVVALNIDAPVDTLVENAVAALGRAAPVRPA